MHILEDDRMAAMTGKGDNQDLVRLERRAGSSMMRSSRKLMALLALVGLVLVGLHFTSASDLLADIDQIKADLRAMGGWAPPIFFVAGTFLTLFGFPRLAVTFAAGILFGSVAGILIALGSTLLGSYLTFCFARRCGADWARRVAERYRKIDFLVSNQTVATVFLVRQLPITNIILNILLSLTRVGHGRFLLGSLLGFMPSAAVAVLSGSSIGESSTAISFFQFGLAGIIVVLSVSTVWRLRRQWTVNYAD